MSSMKHSIPRIYCPPNPATYKKEDIQTITCINGRTIACKLFTPFAKPAQKIDSFRKQHITILLSHGNSDDIGTCSSYCQWLADALCANVVTYDYLNYGHSEKVDTSEENMHMAIEAMYGYLTASLKIQPKRVVLMGKSLGSVPSIFLASQKYATNIAGVILVSPLASGARVLLNGDQLPKNVMNVMDKMFAPSIFRIQTVPSPIFIIHGTQDTVVPVRNSHDLLANMRSRFNEYPPLWVDAGHNDIECAYKNLFVSSIAAFLTHCCPCDDTNSEAEDSISQSASPIHTKTLHSIAEIEKKMEDKNIADRLKDDILGQNDFVAEHKID